VARDEERAIPTANTGFHHVEGELAAQTADEALAFSSAALIARRRQSFDRPGLALRSAR
jgi:hypothetical protein